MVTVKQTVSNSVPTPCSCSSYICQLKIDVAVGVMDRSKYFIVPLVVWWYSIFFVPLVLLHLPNAALAFLHQILCKSTVTPTILTHYIDTELDL